MGAILDITLITSFDQFSLLPKSIPTAQKGKSMGCCFRNFLQIAWHIFELFHTAERDYKLCEIGHLKL
ncbi:MAG: hypothetical protein B6D72_01170 [gamma proteobacterium symbiont of Ctena orbiculata]|nr:MAG: hypothetical protein B6D72_01170 [gamma proteobacterium symbiont of Ctena orbiculata]